MLFTFTNNQNASCVSKLDTMEVSIHAEIQSLKNRLHTIEELLVASNGSNIAYIEDQTDNLCMLSITADPCNLQYIKDKKFEYCMKAVKSDGDALQYCPTTFSDDEMKLLYATSVKNNGMALQHIPEDKRTVELCLSAISNDIFSIDYIPLVDKEIYIPVYRAAIFHVPSFVEQLSFLPRTRFQYLVDYAFTRDYHMFQYLDTPSELQMKEYIAKCSPYEYFECEENILIHNPSFKIRFRLFMKLLAGFFK